jgi:hypothetical protein
LTLLLPVLQHALHLAAPILLLAAHAGGTPTEEGAAAGVLSDTGRLE